MLYNVLVVCAIHQHESIIIINIHMIYIYPFPLEPSSLVCNFVLSGTAGLNDLNI